MNLLESKIAELLGISKAWAEKFTAWLAEN